MITHSEVFSTANRLNEIEHKSKILWYARHQLSQMMSDTQLSYTEEYRVFDKFLRNKMDELKEERDADRFDFYQAIYDAEKELEERG